MTKLPYTKKEGEHFTELLNIIHSDFIDQYKNHQMEVRDILLHLCR